MVVDQLKQMIHGGQFAPGERLNEAVLAIKMGTSRGPIREAVRVLAGWGLVTLIPNRGVFVRKLSIREMLEVYELRAAIFSYAASRAAHRATEADKQKLAQLHDEMSTAMAQEDRALYYDLNLRFHAFVIALAGNQRAGQLYSDYAKELHVFRQRYFDAPGNMRLSNEQHRQLVDAIAKGDSNKAHTVAERHVMEGRERFMAIIGDLIDG